MDSPDRHRPDLARREQQLRRELEQQARTARRRLGDTASKLRADLDRQAGNARRAAPSEAVASARPRGGAPSWDDLEDRLLVWALPAVAVAALPLAAGHLSALLAHGDAPAYPLSAVPAILARLIGGPGDPTQAWAPDNTGGAVPGPVAYWGTFAFLVVVVGLVALLVWAFVRPPSTDGRSSGWARPEVLSDLRLRKGEGHRLVVAEAGGQPLAVAQRHSVLVVGPAHSGKSSGLTVPAVLEWDGPAVVATAKGHVIDETIGWRSHRGDVHVYDPAGITGHHRSGWSLLADCSTWSGAIRTAADLTLAAGSSRHLPGDEGDVARPGALSMALAPFLLAAVVSGRTVGDVVEWIEGGESRAVLEVLTGVDRAAAQVHRLSTARHDDARRTHLLAMAELLQVFVDPVVADSMDRHDIEPAELLDGGAHTLYLTIPEVDQERFRPLCSMLVRQFIASAYEISSRRSAPLDAPLLVVLDDVAGIAPIHDLGGLASTASTHGVQLLSVFQDRGQIDGLYGSRAASLIRNHRVRVVLPGGHRFVDVDDPIVDLDLVGDLQEGEAALTYGSHRPVRVRLRTWHRDRALRRRAETPQDALPPASQGRAAPFVRPATSLADQTARWMRPSRRRSDSSEPSLADPPLAADQASSVDLFGSLDDTEPINVTRLPDRRHRGD